jgi:YesN/AraC family two-component response regulator
MNLLMVNDAVAAVETMKVEIPWAQYEINQVYISYNVAEAKAVILEHVIDILLCDIEMPIENGISLIRWIREFNYDIDCILLTCHADFYYAKEAITLNCHDYILLPASYETIGETVLKVVHRRKERLTNSRLQAYGKTWLNEKEKKVRNENTQKTPHEIIEECVSYIMENLGNEELSVNEIAAHFYLSPIYLNRIFKKEKSITIGQFIIREKMNLAAQLLRTSNHSAVAVAEQVGYPNYSYFSATFKKYFGCTPSQYKE